MGAEGSGGAPMTTSSCPLSARAPRRLRSVFAVWALAFSLPAVAIPTVSMLAVVLPPDGLAWADSPSPVVKYYQVRATREGTPERLADIAQRLLGSSDRADEIFTLNHGRAQPDGARLTDPALLHVGWLLVLPWDAVGEGVVIGPLPSRSGSLPTSSPTASAGAAGTSAPKDGPSTCAPVAAEAIGNIPWAQLRLAPDRAWSTTKGRGVTVAVVDTGVDPSVPALSGRVRAAVTIGTGIGGQAVGCASHGTAMAGIIAAQPLPGTGLIGIAPDVQILPIDVDVVSGTVPASQTAAALSEVVKANAGVALISLPTDFSDPAVTAAIADAVEHDVVVIVGAGSPGASARDGLLRVGAVDTEDTLVRTYPAGSVDVLAPGFAVVTLSTTGTGQIEGSGTDYAVAFVAGLAALVQSASPNISSTAAAHHIETTADRSAGRASADAQYGWGVIDPAAAVQLLAQEPESTPTGGFDARVLWALALVGLVPLWLVASWVRRNRALPLARGRAGRGETRENAAREPQGFRTP